MRTRRSGSVAAAVSAGALFVSALGGCTASTRTPPPTAAPLTSVVTTSAAPDPTSASSSTPKVAVTVPSVAITTSTPPPVTRTTPKTSAEPAPTTSPKPKPKATVFKPSDTVIDGKAIAKVAAYAKTKGYTVGVAVYDTKTDKLYGAGKDTRKFATESVVKAFIATRLLATGKMNPVRRQIAYKMITQSDDASATALYGSVGGDKLVPWVIEHYGISDLGSAPTRPGWWGNTHITAVGMVRFYAAVKKDPKVWPWLSNAMHHAKKYGSDGTYQYFGLKQADPKAGIKQGWGQDDDDWRASSDFNSTGWVDDNRYAVAILVKGPRYEYHSGTPAMVTSVAQRLIPHGKLTAA